MPIADILPTQGDLKTLSDANYQKLKNTIMNRGFSVPVYVWEDTNGVKHLLDGHQRQHILITEGWTEPIPYLHIPALNIQEAMARLLEITSQYATITQTGIYEFIGRYELNDAEIFQSTSFDAVKLYTIDDAEGDGFTLPDGDKTSFQQMTFTLSDEQVEVIKNALDQAKSINGETYGNENRNGNALYWIVQQWVVQRI